MMRYFSLAVFLSAAACGGDPDLECTTRDDCAAGLSCVNNECRAFEPVRDAGLGPDDAGPDASRPDGGGADAAVDGGTTCTRACGDVDVDGDGDVDDTDLAALPALSVSDECVLEAADADGDGEYDDDDAHALRALSSGGASDGCAACSGACGDVDGDGDVDADDATRAAAVVGTTPSVCELLAMDMDRDGSTGLPDAWLVAAAAEGRVTAECTACDADRLCGDFDDNGMVDANDGSALVEVVETPLSPCTHLAADVVADGVIDRRDGYGAFNVAAQNMLGRPHGGCEPCLGNGMCGDVNDDGDIGVADASAIAVIAAATTSTVCERALADLNADGQANARDAFIIGAMRLGWVTPVARCPICTGVCGDVNQDGETSGGDLTRFEAIEGVIGGATLCEWDAANLNGDGSLDARDQRLLTMGTVGTIKTTGPCEPCSGICGDVNNDGDVNIFDRARATAITNGQQPTACEMDNGDIDFDGDIDETDNGLIFDIISGTPPSMPCGR